MDIDRLEFVPTDKIIYPHRYVAVGKMTCYKQHKDFIIRHHNITEDLECPGVMIGILYSFFASIRLHYPVLNDRSGLDWMIDDQVLGDDIYRMRLPKIVYLRYPCRPDEYEDQVSLFTAPKWLYEDWLKKNG